MAEIDVCVVGSGPNGLAAAVVLARAGLRVQVFEAATHAGGAARTAPLTEPGFLHDVGSGVHPMALASPFFRDFGLADRVSFAIPEISYAHPMPDGRTGLAYRDLDRTVEELGRDGRRWRAVFEPLVARIDDLAETTGGAIARIPRHPMTLAALGWRVLRTTSPIGRNGFSGAVAPAMLAGLAAHSVAPQPGLAPSAVGLVLGAHAHARGWPIPIGGSQAISDALVAEIERHGGVVHLSTRVNDIRDLPRHRATVLNLSPRGALAIAGHALPRRYAAMLGRFRYGGGAYKMDFALSDPVPWTDPRLADAGTVHLGGTSASIAAGERDIANGRSPGSPYVLLSQPTRFDPSRAPEGRHTLWAYLHVPAGSGVDYSGLLIDQISRYAPDFRDTILASRSTTPVDLEMMNPNLVGGDIGAGAVTLAQLLARPRLLRSPWATPVRDLYLCSASTAPGPGVHGQAGLHAARAVLRRSFGIDLGVA